MFSLRGPGWAISARFAVDENTSSSRSPEHLPRAESACGARHLRQTPLRWCHTNRESSATSTAANGDTAAFAEVALLGDAATPAPDKLATFQFWAVSAGTGQPAGEWVKIALTVSHGLPLPASARLMGLLKMTLADTTVPTVGTKFTYGHWRPAMAIR